MNRISRFLLRPLAYSVLGLSLLLGATSCTTAARVGVTSDYDHSVNFRAYRTWAWYPQQPTDTEGGPAQGYESFLDKRIRSAVEQQLGVKGMTMVEATATPDVYVAYSARVEDKQRAVGSPYGPYGNPYYGYGYGYGSLYNRGYVTEYKAGTLILDFVDASRKELAWRGQGQAQVDNQTISEVEVQRIVTSILGNYPPQDGRPTSPQAYRE
ncbi:DUF4136 domain-containing protein [Hymenobacter terrestris]|uniref:DUF4136 domain-containing protein n=1 Tax=Hymenobacter terrestris TaxID=2748310 RepID=A0ABX2Q5Q7_9BACT|nr:DUF4136 domain-containing protein [Hymenobacter terrestris]NVO85590.1 DUF4136 domain-containing protein [Hymenobacter terrestris]